MTMSMLGSSVAVHVLMMATLLGVLVNVAGSDVNMPCSLEPYSGAFLLKIWSNISSGSMTADSLAMMVHS